MKKNTRQIRTNKASVKEVKHDSNNNRQAIRTFDFTFQISSLKHCFLNTWSRNIDLDSMETQQSTSID